MIRIRIATAVTLALALAPASAHARRALVEWGLPRERATPEDSVLATHPHPWPGVATTLTAAGIAAPIALMSRPHVGWTGSVVAAWLSVAVLTPAAGHFYGRLPGRALAGCAVRAAGLLLASNATDGFRGEPVDGDLSIWAGIGLMAGSAAWDALSVAGDVDHRNRAWAARQLALGVAVRDHHPMLALTTRF